MRNKSWLCLLVLALGMSLPAWAEDAPKIFSYSGKYAYPDGTPMPDGIYDLLFFLYTTQTGGTPVWQELHRGADKNGVVVNKGNFAVVLGNQSPLPQFDQPYFVALSNPQTGQEQVTRMPLSSAPYAISALNGVPIGTILAWHPNLTNPPLPIPEGFAACNGTTIAVSGGPLRGTLYIPDLNGAGSKGRFLRGGDHSGDMEEDQDNSIDMIQTWNQNGGERLITVPQTGWSLELQTGEDSVGGPDERFRVHKPGNETRPKNMSVVWIIKVK